jgi:hypothetical protein
MFRFLKKILLKKKTNNRKKRNEKEKTSLPDVGLRPSLVIRARGVRQPASAPTSSAYSSTRYEQLSCWAGETLFTA